MEHLTDGRTETSWIRDDEAMTFNEACARLVDECRAGRPEKFTDLVAMTEPRIRGMIRRLTASRSDIDIDDLVQETYLRAWKSLSGFRGESQFSTWLCRIAVNVTKSWKQSQPASTPLPDDPGLFRASDAQLSEDRLMSEYAVALARLSPDLRTVFVLHETEGLSYQDIADAVGCPIGTVMSRLHRARRKLIDELQERLEERTPS